MSLAKAENTMDAEAPPEKPIQPDPSLPAYTASAPQASSSRFQTRFASVSLHKEDRLCFLSFESDAINACRQAIIRSWRRGIQHEHPNRYNRLVEFKLSGHPWRGSGDEATDARRLMCAVLAALHTLGWVVTLSTDISKNEYDKDTILFRHQEPAPAECDWGCIAFSKKDRLRFLNLPPEVHRLVVSKIGRGWIQSQHIAAPSYSEIKLSGSPWSSSGTDTMRARQLLLSLLGALEEEGWSVYASIGQKNGNRDNHGDTDTWHCCRPKGWVKGTPVYHN